MNDITPIQSLAVIGGTGALGSGVVRRALSAGMAVHIGSREPERAEEMAAQLRKDFPEVDVTGSDYVTAVERSESAVLTVPFAHQLDVLGKIRDSLAGKIIIDTTVPLVPPKVARVQLPEDGSAAVRAQRYLGEGVTVVSALHNVPAAGLAAGGDISCDVLVFGDHKPSRARVIEMLGRMDMKAWHGGPLDNSAAAEALTSVLIFINKTYPPGHAGICITMTEGHD